MATASKEKKQGKHLEMSHLELLHSEVDLGQGFSIKLDPETRKWMVLQHSFFFNVDISSILIL